MKSVNRERALNRYAELVVTQGINVQPGQLVMITAETIHRDWVRLLVEKAYQRGAKWVGVDLIDPQLGRIRIAQSQETYLGFVPDFVVRRYEELLDTGGASLAVLGSEDPDVLSGANPDKVRTVFAGRRGALKRFYDEGIGRSKVHWSVVAAATPQWAAKIFANESPEAAYAQLWDAILHATRAYQEDCLELWQRHDEKLRRRAEALTRLSIRELCFRGPGTDLTVTLNDRALFRGGSEIGPRGERFQANIPTEEVFTTPDWRGTRGRVRVTRPVFVNGTLVRDLELEFSAGTIVGSYASQGAEVFQAFLDTDPGARRLGEVALVGVDSPVYQSGLVFEEILFDENAACHIAIGSAYQFCIAGGETMTADELSAVGCNESLVHTDFMISSTEVDVTAVLRDGAELKLLERGEWVWQP